MYSIETGCTAFLLRIPLACRPDFYTGNNSVGNEQNISRKPCCYATHFRSTKQTCYLFPYFLSWRTPARPDLQLVPGRLINLRVAFVHHARFYNHWSKFVSLLHCHPRFGKFMHLLNVSMHIIIFSVVCVCVCVIVGQNRPVSLIYPCFNGEGHAHFCGDYGAFP